MMGPGLGSSGAVPRPFRSSGPRRPSSMRRMPGGELPRLCVQYPPAVRPSGARPRLRMKETRGGYVTPAREESDMSTDTRTESCTPTTGPAIGEPDEQHGLETTLAMLAEMDLAHASDEDVVRALELMVAHAEFPCLGAKSVFRRGSVAHAVLDDMDDPGVPEDLLARLQAF